MGNTTNKKIEVDQAALEEIERRAVRINGMLLRLHHAIERGDLEAIANLRWGAQEANWTNRKALLALGVPDSILLASGLTEYPPDDDDIPMDTDALDLGQLRAIVEQDQAPE